MSLLTSKQKNAILNRKLPINKVDDYCLYRFLKDQHEKIKDLQNYSSSRGREILSLTRKVDTLEKQLELTIRLFMKSTSFDSCQGQCTHSDIEPDKDNEIYEPDVTAPFLYKQYPEIIQGLLQMQPRDD